MTEGSPAEITRDFTVAVFVVENQSVLLHRHRKLDRWLPPGGHIEPNELPDEAALREVLEETGVTAVLVGEPLNPVAIQGQPIQLCRPAGIQLAEIRTSHQHIDLIYFAAYRGGGLLPDSGWFDQHQWDSLELTEEVHAWCELAVNAVDAWTQ